MRVFKEDLEGDLEVELEEEMEGDLLSISDQVWFRLLRLKLKFNSLELDSVVGRLFLSCS